MADVNLAALEKNKAIETCQTVFGMSPEEAEEFVAIARGETKMKTYGFKRRGRGPDPRKIRRDRLGRFAGYVGAAAAGISSAGGGYLGRAISRAITGKPKSIEQVAFGFGLTVAGAQAGQRAGSNLLTRSLKKLRGKRQKKKAEKLARIAAGATHAVATIGPLLGAAYRGYRRYRRKNPRVRRSAYTYTPPAGSTVIDVTKYRFSEYGFKHPGHPNQKVHGARAAARGVANTATRSSVAGRAVRRTIGEIARHVKRSARNTKRVGKLARLAGRGARAGGRLAARSLKNPNSRSRRALRAGGRTFRGAGRAYVRQVKRGVRSRFADSQRRWLKETSASLFVFKNEREGQEPQYRWLLFSSNGFRDRDGEIISTKALERDVALWELEGSPADPLRWWHVALDDQYRSGIELGQTDFRAVHSHTLLESGTFLTKEIGEAVYNAQEKLGASVGFRYSTKDVNSDKVFEAVRIFERSLLPKEDASNLLTHLAVV